MHQKARKNGLGGVIATWGPIVGLIGGLIGITGGGLSLYERFSPPSVEILDLMPIYISEPKTVFGVNSAVRGVGVLLHVRARNRPISLTGLELGGKRCISIDEFPGFVKTDDKTLEEIEAEFDRLRPFQQVSFFGWLADRKGESISLNPWEESYIRFTFLEPGTDSSPGLLIGSRYIGSVQQPFPMTRRYGFNVLEMFTLMPSERTSWTAGHLRNEILDGVLAFGLLTGGAQIVIPTDVVRPSKRLTPDAWKNGDWASMLAEQWPSLELEPTENRSINCYAQTPRPEKPAGKGSRNH